MLPLIFIRCLEGIRGTQLRLIEKTDSDIFSETIRQVVLKKVLEEYYFLRERDRQARPKIEKLEELGIERSDNRDLSGQFRRPHIHRSQEA